MVLLSLLKASLVPHSYHTTRVCVDHPTPITLQRASRNGTCFSHPTAVRINIPLLHREEQIVALWSGVLHMRGMDRIYILLNLHVSRNVDRVGNCLQVALAPP